MITYKGDKFVKGKKFLLDEQVVKFVTKTKKGCIFESIDEKHKTKVVPQEVANNLKEYSKNGKE